MTIKSLELETVCGITSKLPQHDKIEMAFWGRSNVGKSSLLNNLWRAFRPSRVKLRPSIIITSMIYVTWWICLDMVMLKFPRRFRQNGRV